MRLSFGQELKLVQKQILAPRMIQSMEILQLPIMELQERIEQEMPRIPAWTSWRTTPTCRTKQRRRRGKPRRSTSEERELVVDETKNNEEDFERLPNLDEEWPDTFEERPRPLSTRMEEESNRKHDAIANMVARPQTLQDYLCDQLSWFELDEARGKWPSGSSTAWTPTAGCQDSWKT